MLAGPYAHFAWSERAAPTQGVKPKPRLCINLQSSTMSTYRNHYVPRLYLRAFASDLAQGARRLHVYNLEQRQAIPNASLRDQCYGHRMYGDREDIETSLGKLETQFTPMLAEIVARSALPTTGSAERELLYLFIALQLLRPPPSAEVFELRVDKMLQQVSAQEPRMKALNIEQASADFKNTAEYPLQFVAQLADDLEDLTMHVVCSRADQIFITSDNPAVEYNQYLQGLRGTGITGSLHRGLQIFLPISPHHLLMLYDNTVYRVGTPRSPEVTYSIPNSDVMQLNRLQIHNAAKNVYFNDWDQMHNVEELVKKSIAGRIEDRIVVKGVEQETSRRRTRWLMNQYVVTPNVLLNLTFVRIKKDAKRHGPAARLTHTHKFRKPPLLVQAELEDQLPTANRRKASQLKPSSPGKV